jgi:hypothetical protein
MLRLTQSAVRVPLAGSEVGAVVEEVVLLLLKPAYEPKTDDVPLQFNVIETAKAGDAVQSMIRESNQQRARISPPEKLGILHTSEDAARASLE